MNTYKNIAEFMLHLIETCGKTDAQSHVGHLYAYDDAETIVSNHFGGKILRKSDDLKIKEDDYIFYVYTDENLPEYAKWVQEFFDDENDFSVEDTFGNTIYCFVISD